MSCGTPMVPLAQALSAEAAGKGSDNNSNTEPGGIESKDKALRLPSSSSSSTTAPAASPHQTSNV